MVDELRAHGHTAMSFKADVSNEENVAKMFAAVREEFGTVDILIDDAGLQQDAPVDQMTLAQWNKVISVNLTGQFLCARGGDPRIQTPLRAAGDFLLRRQDHLHQLSARTDPMGRPRELCGFERA